jgi:hypothetical protein
VVENEPQGVQAGCEEDGVGGVQHRHVQNNASDEQAAPTQRMEFAVSAELHYAAQQSPAPENIILVEIVPLTMSVRILLNRSMISAEDDVVDCVTQV